MMEPLVTERVLVRGNQFTRLVLAKTLNVARSFVVSIAPPSASVKLSLILLSVINSGWLSRSGTSTRRMALVLWTLVNPLLMNTEYVPASERSTLVSASVALAPLGALVPFFRH